MSADYRFSLERPTERFRSLGAGLSPAAMRLVMSPALLNAASSALSANLRTNLRQILDEVRLDVWTRDAQYASSARIVDYRQENCCSIAGGMRCRSPYMTFQMWNLGVPCDSMSMGSYLFPLDRFVWAQNELRRLLREVPGYNRSGMTPISLSSVPYGLSANREMDTRTFTGNQRIATDPAGWAQWCAKVMRCVALLRWSTNLRWDLVSAAPGMTPNIDAYRFYYGKYLHPRWDHEGDPIDIPELRRRVQRSMAQPIAPENQKHVEREIRRILDYGKTNLVRLSPYTWDYDQMGSREGYAASNPEGTLADLPLRPVKVPVNRAEFDPMIAWENTPWYPPLPPEDMAPGLRRAATAEQLLAKHFEILGLVGQDDFRKFKWAFSFTAPQYEYGGGLRDQPVTAWLPSPYAQVLECAAMAQDALAFDYLSLINKSLEEWLVRYEELPEQFRVLDPQQMRDAMAAAVRAQAEAASATIAGAGGAIAGIAAAINPIAGVVITILVSLAALVARLAADLCIILADNPPWVASPFIRFIDTGEDGQGACDFEVTDAGGVAAFANTKAALIRGMAERGITPDRWFEVLDTIEETSPDMRGDGSGDDGTDPDEISPLAVGAALSALLLLLWGVKKAKTKSGVAGLFGMTDEQLCDDKARRAEAFRKHLWKSDPDDDWDGERKRLRAWYEESEEACWRVLDKETRSRRRSR